MIIDSVTFLKFKISPSQWAYTIWEECYMDTLAGTHFKCSWVSRSIGEVFTNYFQIIASCQLYLPIGFLWIDILQLCGRRRIWYFPLGTICEFARMVVTESKLPTERRWRKDGAHFNFPRHRHSSRGWDKDTLNEVVKTAAAVVATDVSVGDYDGVKGEQVDDRYADTYSPLYLQWYPERSFFVCIRGTGA